MAAFHAFEQLLCTAESPFDILDRDSIFQAANNSRIENFAMKVQNMSAMQLQSIAQGILCPVAALSGGWVTRAAKQQRRTADAALPGRQAGTENCRTHALVADRSSLEQQAQSSLTLPSFDGALDFYTEAGEAFDQLLQTEDLDIWIRSNKGVQEVGQKVEHAVQCAMRQAYKRDGYSEEDKVAHLFLQRILYKINRMVLFWYDDLRNYANERSLWLAALRDRIEEQWQAWELEQVDAQISSRMSVEEVKAEVERRASEDVDPEPSDAQLYMRRDMSLAGYKHLLAVASVDGLTEASRQSRVCGGVANEVMCAVFRVLMEEYGTGRYAKKHSTFFVKMMDELGLSTAPEHYCGLVPWQSLAAMNHNFLLTERRRHYLRYLGGLTFFEVNGPSVYTTYLLGAQRLGLSEDASGYWALHIKEDERHGRQMVHDVALPLADMYPKDAWEVLLGYEQEKMMGERAGAALVKDIMAVDRQHAADD